MILAITLAALIVLCGSIAAGGYSPDIRPALFSDMIDNEYLPLRPGARWVYEGETPEGTERIVVTVTRRTKSVLGVRCVVVRDVVRLNGSVIEDTDDWFAQHEDGTVWYFGEATKELEKGKVVSTAGSWEAGVDGAEPGIAMLGKPAVGASYRQEYYRGEAEDKASVISVSESVTVPFDTFDGLVKTKDFTPLDRSVVEHKYYAAGVGLVLEVHIRGGSQRVELVEYRAPT